MESMPERFWLPDTLVAVALDIFQETVNPPKNFPDLGLPPEIIIPSRVVPCEFHSMRPCSVPPPFSSLSIEARSRRALAGLLRR